MSRTSVSARTVIGPQWGLRVAADSLGPESALLFFWLGVSPLSYPPRPQNLASRP